MVRGTPARGTPSRAVADAAIDTAEVVFLGELTGATGVKETCSGSVLCKYVVVHGEHWHLSRGDVSGATQASWPSACGGELAAWGHPLQLSFNTTSVQVRAVRFPRPPRSHPISIQRLPRAPPLPARRPPLPLLTHPRPSVRAPSPSPRRDAGLAQASVRAVRARRVGRRGHLRGLRRVRAPPEPRDAHPSRALLRGERSKPPPAPGDGTLLRRRAR